MQSNSEQLISLPAWEVDPTRQDLQAESDLDVWLVDLDEYQRPPKEAVYMLEDRELWCLSRFTDSQARHDYLVQRVALRQILAAYLDIPPAGVRLVLQAYQKPRLEPGRFDGALDFNLAHSANLMLLACSFKGRVGADIEKASPLNDLNTLAARTLSLLERHRILRNSGIDSDAFYQYWTCKEAYLKGIGKGLSADPRWIEILFEAGRHRVRERSLQSGWTVFPFSPAAGFQAAVATNQGECSVIRFWRLQKSASLTCPP
jgi:4'-phosphopantetheinyl transferase